MADDPFKWFKDQAHQFHRDQRLRKKASRERLERAGTEAPTRKKLAEISDTNDEPGMTEDWGRQGELSRRNES